MEKFVQTAKQFWNDESGVTAVEYAVMIAIVSALIIGGGNLLGPAVKGAFDAIAGQL